MPGSDLASNVSGLRVFLAEDEFHVLQLIEDMLVELGCIVVNSSSNVSAAMRAAETTEAQVAMLDINLAGKPIYPVARILKHRGIPVLFSTGYGFAGIDPEWKRCSVIQKPFAIGELCSALAAFR
jgi:DNA-binding response OmpR family regulator